jgi:hypothetical protein
MTAEKVLEVSLNDALQRIRNAAVYGNPVTVESEVNSDGNSAVVLQIDGEKFLVKEPPPVFPIVGCDLLNYSGLTDLEQYFVGVLLPFEILQAQKYAKLEGKQPFVGTSGTGDGALIALKCDADALWQPVLFAARLWYEGRGSAYGRGLRVALTLGSCIKGREFIGVPQLQGYGLVEAARILGCDKGTHVMLSRAYWEKLAELNATEAEGSYAGNNVRLQRTSTIFSGKSKADDRLETSYVNCFGSVTEEDGSSWDFGVEDEEGLSHPGKKDSTESLVEPTKSGPIPRT